jgi:hypothetical protein
MGQGVQGVAVGPAQEPQDLTEAQAAQLGRFRRSRGGIWQAYEMKEQFRAIPAGDLSRDDAGQLLERGCARASGRDWRRSWGGEASAVRTVREYPLTFRDASTGESEGYDG